MFDKEVSSYLYPIILKHSEKYQQTQSKALKLLTDQINFKAQRNEGKKKMEYKNFHMPDFEES